MCGLAALCLLLLQTGTVGFSILAGEPFNHQEITERAILNVTIQTCHALAVAEGKTFIFPPQPFTADSVAAACEASQSSKSFHRSIFLIKTMNWKTDIQNVFDPSYHFDGETFTDGRKLITEGLSVVKAAIKKHSFVSAKSNLGVILHPLQDFYSHTNWVEIGNNLPNSNLIRADTSIGNIAAKSRPTCRNCDGNDCRDNILEDILQEKILTSGYFGFVFSKPTGKCSHGGIPDSTSLIEPKGGINKDTFTSSHGHLHRQAANLAIAATTELLQDVREAAGDKLFLQMLGINKGSSKPICFVLDTTESMRDDIVTLKAITSSIINTKVGTNDEPSSYIIVPFGDPDFGPLMRTTDPEFFENYINLLSADGGGDFPEMSLSGLQLALTGSPSDSEIFVITDASAKDPHLKDTVMALIEQTNTVVNFLITNPERLNHRAQDDNLQLGGSQLAKADIQLYEDLARASGGQVIEITKLQLLEATSIISKSSSSSLVSLLQVSRNLGAAENFTFIVDESVSNLTIYITGSSVNFTLISPSGVQHSTDTNDSSIVTSQTMGNFQALHLKTQVGMWKINMASADYYTLRVVGESPVDFLFDFLRESHGQLGGFDLVDNRPIAGGNGSLMVILTGSDTATVTEVTLVQSSGAGQVEGHVETLGEGEFFVQFDRIPPAEFVVLVKGLNSNRTCSGIFQRQSTTSLRPSNLTVTADDSDTSFEPGTTLSVPFSVITNGAGGTFSIHATNDQGFNFTSPSTLFLETGVIANATVNLTAPLNTPSGTGVTLTIQVVAPGGKDINYDVLYLTVLTTVTDITKPLCQLLSLQANCSDNCSQSLWELSVQVTDGAEGTGVDHINLRQGIGTLNTSKATGSDNITLVNYTASCCSPDVQLVAVDGVGNVMPCSFSVHAVISRAAASFSARALQSVLLCFGITVLRLTLSSEMDKD